MIELIDVIIFLIKKLFKSLKKIFLSNLIN